MIENLTPILLGFMGMGPTELLVIGGIVMLLFGSTRLPGLMRNLGRSAVEFKKGMQDDTPIDEEDEKKKTSGE